jgi:hypothetical protein
MVANGFVPSLASIQRPASKPTTTMPAAINPIMSPSSVAMPIARPNCFIFLLPQGDGAKPQKGQVTKHFIMQA